MRPVSWAVTGRTSLRGTAAVALALALASTAACGGLDKDEQKAADSLSREFQSAGLTAKDGDCVAKKWVEKTGTGKLVDAGVLTKSLAADQKNRKKPTRTIVEPYVDAYFDCVDYGRNEAVQFDKNRPNIIDKDQFAACANKIDQDDAKQAMTDDLLGKSTKTSTNVQHQLIECATSR